MSKIAVLPDLLINKIAAGEVIERPASVVRELIDNSIDAGSSRIDVEILHAGKKLIKVSDNGCGMERDDALACFERHATSKIKSEKELFDISTLGFRGEAIPAIGSVSKVTLTTSPPGSDSGTTVEIGANQQKEVSDAPPAGGTTIEIRDIFYNMPARRKFLKTNPTELSHIIDTVVAKAFAYYGISFSLRHNGSEMLNTPAASGLKERFSQLYGAEMAGEFVEIDKKSKVIEVRGFVSSPGVTRGTRSHQYIFVNKRPVKNTTVNHGVYNAYRGSLPGGRHPAYFIFLEIDPGKVDVNVHPAKREVKFERADDVHRFVDAAVYEALNPGAEVNVDAAAMSRPFSSVRSTGGFQYTKNEMHNNEPVVNESSKPFLNESQTDIFSSGVTDDVAPFFSIGEAFVAKVSGDGLEIIDRHAAHERVLYEQFMKKTSIEADPLFLPLRIELPLKEHSLLTRHKSVLQEMGLDIDDFGGNAVIIRSLPKSLNKADMKNLLLDVASGILQEQTEGIKKDVSGESLLKSIASRLACHKAVRGSEPLSDAEMRKLLSDLDSMDEPDKCPHGRPTRISLSLDDLQKMFMRK